MYYIRKLLDKQERRRSLYLRNIWRLPQRVKRLENEKKTGTFSQHRDFCQLYSNSSTEDEVGRHHQIGQYSEEKWGWGRGRGKVVWVLADVYDRRFSGFEAKLIWNGTRKFVCYADIPAFLKKTPSQYKRLLEPNPLPLSVSLTLSNYPIQWHC